MFMPIKQIAAAIWNRTVARVTHKHALVKSTVKSSYRKIQATMVPSSRNAPTFILKCANRWSMNSESGLRCGQNELTFSKS